MRIYIKDIRDAGHCVKGTRDWFDRHGLDFRKFLREGISEEEFTTKGDALARRIVDLKKSREQ